MNIYISENIKRLRREKNLTQEALADFIGISFQAVSKWECGDAYPDITLLPTLANFFEVTLDELVGMNEIKNAKKLDEIKEQYRKFNTNKTHKEVRELLRGGLKIFPNDYWLLSELAFNLSFQDNGETDEECNKNNEEAVKISERILEFCTDSEIRNRVQANMCLSLWKMGEKDKAVELAKKLPKINETSERTLTFIQDDGKEKIKLRQDNVLTFTAELEDNIRGLAQTDHYTDDEKFKLYQKAIDIYKIIYEERNYDIGHVYLCDIYINMAKIYIKRDNKNEAVKSLEEAAKNIIAYLNRIDSPLEIGKSLLINSIGKTTTMKGVNHARDTKNRIDGEPFESIREREEIKNILTELDKYAN
ncbi:MAG: helix-turn-helix domain-containing protein [Oscillospiraceae bacterium]|nr:helix-turn-helix domain-containing protein [Oscillospiraceae bacterium]